MKVINAKEEKAVYITMENYPHQWEYRRWQSGVWEQAEGELSWKPCYGKGEPELLEAAYQAHLKEKAVTEPRSILCDGVLSHKFLDSVCDAKGCQSLVLKARLEEIGKGDRSLPVPVSISEEFKHSITLTIDLTAEGEVHSANLIHQQEIPNTLAIDCINKVLPQLQTEGVSFSEEG